MPVTRTSFAGAAVVAVANRWSASRLCAAKDSSTCRSTAGRQVEVITVGTAKTASNSSSGSIDASRARVIATRTSQPIVPSTRHVHVVQHEDLVAQHRQPVEIVRALVQLKPRHRGLQGGHVGLQGDRHPIAEPSVSRVVITCRNQVRVAEAAIAATMRRSAGCRD